jgi:lysophospholipase L1-like esterase
VPASAAPPASEGSAGDENTLSPAAVGAEPVAAPKTGSEPVGGESPGGAAGAEPPPAEPNAVSPPVRPSEPDLPPEAAPPITVPGEAEPPVLEEPKPADDEPENGPEDPAVAPPAGAEPGTDEPPAVVEPPVVPGEPSGEAGEDPPGGGGTPPGSVNPPPAANGSVGPGSAEIPNGLPDFHITVIGSSTANGIGASTGDFAWVTLLDEALSRKVTTSYSMSNLAVGGYKAAELLPGSGARGSVDDAIAERPDLIVVALAGSNDIEPGFTTEMFMSQMAAIREAARAAGIPTFFMSTLPKSLSVGEREILGEWSGLMAAEFAECWIPGTTKAYAPCYIDVFDALADPSLGLATQFDSGDGQHPNDLGHELLFEAADAIVEPYLCTKTECR